MRREEVHSEKKTFGQDPFANYWVCYWRRDPCPEVDILFNATFKINYPEQRSHL